MEKRLWEKCVEFHGLLRRAGRVTATTENSGSGILSNSDGGGDAVF